MSKLHTTWAHDKVTYHIGHTYTHLAACTGACPTQDLLSPAATHHCLYDETKATNTCNGNVLCPSLLMAVMWDSQVISVLLPLMTNNSWQAQQAVLLAIKGLATKGVALQPWLPALVPALLETACHSRPEVSENSLISTLLAALYLPVLLLHVFLLFFLFVLTGMVAAGVHGSR